MATLCLLRSGKHCTDKLRSVGFEPVTNWESTLIDKYLQMVLSVYTNDFKMAGPVDDMKNGLVDH